VSVGFGVVLPVIKTISLGVSASFGVVLPVIKTISLAVSVGLRGNQNVWRIISLGDK
jgi:hypothetical protein